MPDHHLGPVGPGAVRHRPVRRRAAGRLVHLAVHELGRGRGVRLGPLAQQERPRGALVLRRLPGHADVGGRGVAGAPARRVQNAITHVRPGGGRDAAAGRAGLPDPAA